MTAPKKSLNPKFVKKRRDGRFGGNQTQSLLEKRRQAWQTAADKVAAKYLQAAETASVSGKQMRLTILVPPTSSMPDIALEDIAPEPDALDVALSAARDRGKQRVADILSGPEMLSADDIAAEIKVSRETVNNKRKRHELLGLEGPKRGVRFPRWQLSDRGELLPGLPQLFSVIGDRPWAIYRFLLQPHGALDGRTGLEAIKSGDIERVADVARSIGEGAFT